MHTGCYSKPASQDFEKGRPKDHDNCSRWGRKDDPDWNEVTSFGPWEPFFDATNGKPRDKKRAWESGVEGVNGGSWEKTFPLAE